MTSDVDYRKYATLSTKVGQESSIFRVFNAAVRIFTAAAVCVDGPLFTIPFFTDLTQKHLFPPIYDQGFINSCVPQVVTAMYAHRVLNFIGADKYTPISRLDLYYHTRELMGTTNVDTGSNLEKSLLAAQNGTCKESIWPYDQAKVLSMPSEECYNNREVYRVVEFMGVNRDTDSVKCAISRGYPVMIVFNIYPVFHMLNAANNYTMDVPDDTTFLGGHSLLLVGFDDDTRKFRARNSWGEGFADKGMLYVTYDFVANGSHASDFWIVTKVVSEGVYSDEIIKNNTNPVVTNNTDPLDNNTNPINDTNIKPDPNGRCGPAIGSCAPGACCSRFGFCGTTALYCDSDCQIEYGTGCNSTVNVSSSSSSSTGVDYLSSSSSTGVEYSSSSTGVDYLSSSSTGFESSTAIPFSATSIPSPDEASSSTGTFPTNNTVNPVDDTTDPHDNPQPEPQPDVVPQPDNCTYYTNYTQYYNGTNGNCTDWNNSGAKTYSMSLSASTLISVFLFVLYSF